MAAAPSVAVALGGTLELERKFAILAIGPEELRARAIARLAPGR
jgi:hypothetical protein